MKTLFSLVCVLILTATGAYAQSAYTQISKLKGITETVVTPEMFELIAAIDLDADNPEVRTYKEIINNLKELRVYTLNNSASTDEFRAIAQGFIGQQNLTKLMHVKEENSQFNFYYKPGSTKEKIKELVMFLDAQNSKGPEMVFMVISGDIDLKQVSKLTRTLNIPGSDQLEKATQEK